MKDYNKELREASGTVTYPASDWLTSFLYELMRDAAAPGNVESVVRHIQEEDREGDNVYTNGWLAQYAKNLADRLRGEAAKKDYFVLTEYLKALDTSDFYGDDLYWYIHNKIKTSPLPGQYMEEYSFWNNLTPAEQMEAVNLILENGYKHSEREA